MTNVINRILNVARANPEKLAIADDNAHLTYGAMIELAGGVAARLRHERARGYVMIELPRSARVAPALLGVWLAGCGCMVINAGDPRKPFLWKDCGASFLVDEAFLDTTRPQAPASIDIDPKDAALLVYTSGSTGDPKGVILDHGAVDEAARCHLRYLSADDVGASVAPFAFIAIIMEIVSPLIAGSSIWIASNESRRDVHALAGFFAAHGVTRSIVPSALARPFLARYDGLLRVAIVGTEVIRNIYGAKTKVVSLYGSSETCGPFCAFEIDRPYEITPLGKSMSGAAIYVLDDDLRKAAPGQTGEICVCGPIARGYLNRPERTRQAFVKNPYAVGADDQTLFKTGDLGYMDETGTLHYLQRKDWMIKVRGNRVEPGEVESAIRKHLPVREAVVKGVRRSGGDIVLCAFYLSDEPVSVDFFKAALAQCLPEYMIPGLYQRMDSFPLNSNGKLDRNALVYTGANRNAYAAPTNAREEALCKAFEQVLEADHVGALDDFMLLGGDSLSAVRLQTALPGHIALSVSDILEFRTPQALAARADAGIEIVPSGDRAQWPLTEAQRRMAVEQRLDPASVAYNINLAFALEGAVDEERLEQALNALVARHRILRSYFVYEADEWVQKVAEAVRVPLDKWPMAGEDLQQVVNRHDLPYDLSRAPLCRFALIEGEETILYMGFHHIVLDGMSSPALLRDLWTLYAAEEALPEVGVDYLDYALSEADAPEDQNARAYFRAEFADGLPENEMPLRGPRPRIQPVANCKRRLSIDSETYAALTDKARALGATGSTLVFAALALTLGRYVSGEDLVLGMAMNGRTLPQTSDMIGMFAGILPIRIAFSASDSAEDFVRYVRRQLESARKYQSFSFEKLAPELGATRNPVYDVVFNDLEETPVYRIGELTARPVAIDDQSLTMDLVVNARHGADGLKLILSYSDALYDHDLIENFADQLAVVLQRMADEAPQTLAQLVDLPEAQYAWLAQNETSGDLTLPTERTLTEAFAKSVRLYPDNLALCDETAGLTYAQLDEMTDALARALAAMGAGRGKVVGVLLDRDNWMPATKLAVLKTGAAYLPMNFDYPTDRLLFMLEDAGVEIVVSTPEHEARIEGFTGRIIAPQALLDAPKSEAPLEKPRPDDLVGLVYTSGTTGKPKGVMLCHLNLVHFCENYRQIMNITREDHVLAHSNCCFDASMMDIWPTLATGASIHVVPERLRLDIPGLKRFCAEHGATVGFMTTQLGRQMVESTRETTLRALMLGGEALLPFDNPANIRIINGYGPSECTVISTTHLVKRGEEKIPIGRALNGLKTYVLDKNGRKAPMGVVGELYIAGPHVSTGYLNQPELTRQRFLPNPFAQRSEDAVMYRSGDLVRILPSGELDYLRRADTQVKIRGFRIELGEIEARIRLFPGVRNVTVTAMDDPAGGKCAVAYYVSDQPLDEEKLSRFILETLPDYMLPSAFCKLDAIPVTPNGKVDHRRLSAPRFRAVSQPQGEARALTEIEKTLMDIAAALIGHAPGGVSSDLTREGLQSLGAIRMTSRVENIYGVEVSARDLLANPTILWLENAVVRALLARKEQASPPKPTPARRLYPLTHSQKGVYLDCARKPDDLSYHIHLRVDLPAETDEKRLIAAVKRAVDAHPALKARLAEKDAEMMLERRDEDAIELPFEQIEKDALDNRCRAFVRPFDLTQDPLCRFLALRHEDGLTLLMDAHHLIFDGISAGIFFEDVDAAYRGEALPAEKETLFDRALAEEAIEESDGWSSSRAYFEQMLNKCDGASELAADQKRRSGCGAMQEEVRALNRRAVADFCQRYGLSITALLLGAAGYAISRFVREDDVYLSTISGGRDDARLSRSVGMFVRTLPIRLSRRADMTVVQYLRAASDALRDAIAHEDYPFTRIAEEYHYAPTIMFASELGVMQGVRFNGATVACRPILRQPPKFRVSIHAEERDGELVYALQYDDGLYSQAFIRRLLAAMTNALSHMTVSPDAPASRVLLTDKDAPADQPRRKPLEGEEAVLIDAWRHAVEAHRNETALIASDRSLTFAQLDLLANRVANALLARGVRTGDRVAYMLPRTSNVLVAMLAICKASAAFVPIGMDYPQARVEHILRDSEARFLLSDASTPDPSGKTLHICDLLAEGDEREPACGASPGDLAYIIYTSGSTGTPKGVMIPQRGIANYVTPNPQNAQVHAIWAYASRVLSITTTTFDMFLKESLGALMNGRALVFASEAETRDPLLLSALFARTGADAFNATPSRMLEYLRLPELRQAILRCAVVMAGAEQYPAALIEALSESKAHLFNGYGPTETTITSNAKELRLGESVTVGAPQWNVREYVVDTDGNELPVGVSGELLIGGRGVALGYRNLPEQTQKSFITHQGERVYRSGDLARWTENGEIEILGRIDQQVKLRGLRIELPEVENALLRIEGIIACAAAVKTLPGGDQLCAYCVSPNTLDFDRVRDDLRKVLPEYMTPTVFMQLDALLRTPSGKVNSRALPMPEQKPEPRYEAPMDETEAALCTLFSSVLNVSRVGATDDFFALGGTSLGVTRLLIEARKRDLKSQNGASIAYGDVFANPTPRKMAALLGGRPIKSGKEESADDFDDADIRELLRAQSLAGMKDAPKRPLGNILLTGATGFLGITVLHTFLRQESGTAYCLIRKGKRTSVEQRLKNLLFYYFESEDIDEIGRRVHVVEGDVTDEAVFERMLDLPVDTLIHCAANVSHFGSGNAIERVNVEGTRNCVRFAQRKRIRLIHTSTVSVAGLSTPDATGEYAVLTERDLFIGQSLPNEYIHSKFIAEREVLRAVCHGLDAKIMRLGNLMARASDGEFQINLHGSTAVGRLRAFALLHEYPYAFMENQIEFSPVDQTASALLLLAKTPERYVVFHPLSDRMISEGELIALLEQLGVKMRWVEQDAFDAALAQVPTELAGEITSLIAYQGMTRDKRVRPLRFSRSFTVQALCRLGWRWALPESYYQSAMRSLDTLGFFGDHDQTPQPPEFL